MSRRNDATRLFEQLELTEYERDALEHLLSLGRMTAPNLSEATGIPKARIYGVLDSLADSGYIKIVPRRPKQYIPKPPGEILDRATENQRQQYESFTQEIEEIRDEFIATFEPLYEQATDETTPTEELFHVVDVGEPSETETRQLYRTATDQLNIITKSFEYWPNVEATLRDVQTSEVDCRILFLDPDHLSEQNRAVQRDRVKTIRSVLSDVSMRFSREPLPWRGTIIDPSMDYERGKAVLLVEEKNIPLHMRQAAITENGSFVAGLSRYFDLIWEHESAIKYDD